ncbi:glycosyltransferase family 2 protein [Kosmotoga pacifica]|uniref:Glycosyltransferase 2-like domain-containing protein n=1 Tax=Kosmotoga pacifica TaxID=1330330 RepID=A0A0G2ZCQ3_9BACT|nr:glycosyltransferase family 2 protein [Kosmotoga pacifica]AKI96523.1 hypothetical protein IX53_00320 [Kosmotoga pacifica]
MLPVVSVVIPARNEEQFIGKCLDGFLNQDYPLDSMEIIVVDGMSEDRTSKVVEEYSKKFPLIRLIKNPRRTTPVALNLGIKEAKGKYILFSGAHSEIPKDYVSKFVKYITEYNADNVGGLVLTVPRRDTLKGKVIAEILSSKFGVGGAKFRTGIDQPEEVDTVPFGFYRRDVFEKVGYFNEKLVRNQDIELNLRLKRAGGKIMLFPDVVLTYFSRSTFKEFWKNNFGNGFWVIYGSKFSKLPFSLRHLVPLLFVIFLLAGGVLSLFSHHARNIFIAVFGLYMMLDILYSIPISKKLKSLKAFFLALFGFLSLHISYGLGSLAGIFKLIVGGK